MDTRVPDRAIVVAALRIANLSGDPLARKGRGLSEAEIALYRTILRAFPEHGGPPCLDEIHSAARDLGLDSASALTRLHQLDLIRLDQTGSTIAAAYPFSGQPTAHRIAIAGAQPVYAMCAVDALGIPFMLDRDTRINSVDPISSGPVQVTVKAGQAAWEPAGAVVFIGKVCQEGPSAQVCCSVINFFTSSETAEAYQQEYPDVHGRIVAIPEALEAGRQVFSNLLRRKESGGCDASCCC